jgi:2-phosphosulfolactate phosphatase
VSEVHDQQEFAVRCEWASNGARAAGARARYAVVVDVLRFTTALSVAVDAGAEVFPYPWNDASARDFADRHQATLADGRPAADRAGSRDPAGRGPVSLSPVSIRAAPGLSRLVLPSPNGSALACELAAAGVTVVGACLRNRRAVGRWLAGRNTAGGQDVIAVIAAGERWPDGSLRAAVEDLWGAGAVLAALADLGLTGLSPEARTAAAAFRAVQDDLPAELLSCSSGVELSARGYRGDVAIAAELDASGCVPVLDNGRFTDARHATPDAT